MNFEAGESIIEELEILLARALSEKVTAGIAVAASGINWTSDYTFVHTAGFTRLGVRKIRITEKTYFDLASLTKPLVTVVSLLTLLQQKKITLHSPLEELLPQVKIPKDKKNIQLWHLMSHCSGLPAHRPYFAGALGQKKSERKISILQSILSEKVEYPFGAKHLYSDLGYILLGFVIEQLTEMPLDRYYTTRILEPLGLDNALKFIPLDMDKAEKKIAATEKCPWTNKLLCGTVHDDNCRVMGGVAGHAGLFGTVQGVANICYRLNETWKGRNEAMNNLFSSELLQRIFTRIQGSTWTCGFDTPSVSGSSSGIYFGKKSVGHLGFTGTSLWMDLAKGISIVVLANRVNPSRKNEAMKRLRPEIHDIIMKNSIKKAPDRDI